MGIQTVAAAAFELRLDDGLSIRGVVNALDNGVRKPTVVLIHGFRGHKDWAFWPDVAGRLAEKGFYVVRFDYSRLSARSAGLDERAVAEASTLTRELRDLESVVRALEAGRLPLPEQADAARLAILGHSRAGGSSIVFAAEHPEVKALVVWNGGSSPVRVAGPSDPEPTLLERALRQERESLGDRFRLPDRFAELRAAALVIQGDKDRWELLEQLEEFRRKAPHQHFVTVWNADHTFNAAHPYDGPTAELLEALDATVRFLREKLD